jgi:hypothetical protein
MSLSTACNLSKLIIINMKKKFLCFWISEVSLLCLWKPTIGPVLFYRLVPFHHVSLKSGLILFSLVTPRFTETYLTLMCSYEEAGHVNTTAMLSWVEFILRSTVSRPVHLVSGSSLEHMTRFYPYPFFSDNCFVVLPVRRPLWREDESVIAIADWSVSEDQ